ncbi:ABC transporter permease [bacterium]|nr:ABC transporter permease [bacterium]
MSASQAFVRVFGREWRTIFKDKTIRNVMLIVPVLYCAMFGWLYSAQRVTDLPLVVVDQDRSALSRELVRALDQDQTFRVTAHLRSEAEALAEIDAARAAVAVVIPPSLEQDVKRGREAAVLTLVDGANMMVSNTAVRAANTDIKTISAGITLKKLAARGQWGSVGERTFTGIDYRYRVLFNPTFSYADFMVLGLVGAALQQVLLLGVALGATREKEAGTWHQTLETTPFWALWLGKTLPYWLVTMTMTVLCLSVAVFGFGLPVHGPLWPVLLVSGVFCLAVAALGLLISFAFSTQLMATQVAMLIAVPSFMLSGFTWPQMAMPQPLAVVSQLLPLTYYLHAIREVVSKGHGLESLATDFVALLAMTLVSLVALVWLRARAVAKAPVPDARLAQANATL